MGGCGVWLVVFFLLFFWQSMKFAPGPVPCCSFFQPPSLFSCVPPSPDPRPCWLPKLPFSLPNSSSATSAPHLQARKRLEENRELGGMNWGGCRDRKREGRGKKRGQGGTPQYLKQEEALPVAQTPSGCGLGMGWGYPAPRPPAWAGPPRRRLRGYRGVQEVVGGCPLRHPGGVGVG